VGIARRAESTGRADRDSSEWTAPLGKFENGNPKKANGERQERIFVNIAVLGRWRVSISVCLQHTDKSFRLHGGRIGTGARGMHN
jgi:hypothetical protein